LQNKKLGRGGAFTILKERWRPGDVAMKSNLGGREMGPAAHRRGRGGAKKAGDFTQRSSKRIREGDRRNESGFFTIKKERYN